MYMCIYAHVNVIRNKVYYCFLKLITIVSRTCKTYNR